MDRGSLRVSSLKHQGLKDISLLPGCPQGLFGMNCTQSCSCVRGTCNPHDGTCECPPGYYGYLCDNPCPSGWHGPGCGLKCLCGNGAACDHQTGQCRCSPGWTGLTCQQSCFNVSTVVGFFGANCSERYFLESKISLRTTERSKRVTQLSSRRLLDDRCC